MPGVGDIVVNIFEVSTMTLTEVSVSNISDPSLKQEITAILSSPRVAIHGRLTKILL